MFRCGLCLDKDLFVVGLFCSKVKVHSYLMARCLQDATSKMSTSCRPFFGAQDGALFSSIRYCFGPF